MTAKKTPELKLVPLSKIKISGTNPRKTFDQDAIDELALSIKEKGVIQPILLRPLTNDTYELVCGERRYRASLIAAQVNSACKDIPAYIRDLNDDEALSLQLTENLQRKDVHPMEEAAAFKVLLSRKDMSEVCSITGKTQYFVNQRVKLMDLSEEWQKIFFHNLITITEALKIASLAKEAQDDMRENLVDDNPNYSTMKPLNIGSWTFNKYQGKLSEATFSLDDTELDKKAGACSTCQYNSGISGLFPDGAQNAICGNFSCFSKKTDLHYNIELKAAIDDPAVILVSNNYGLTKDATKLINEGHKVYAQKDFKEVYEPEAPDYEVFKEDEYESCDTEEEFKQMWAAEVEDYEKQKAEYLKEIESGK